MQKSTKQTTNSLFGGVKKLLPLLLFPLLGAGSLSAQVTVTNMAVVNAAAKEISFTVSWTAQPYNNQIWVITDYVKVAGAAIEGSWSRALVTSAAATGSGSAATFTGHRGFWLNTSGASGSATVTATLQLASDVSQFNWCAYALDTPPQAVAQTAGGYKLQGSPPFQIEYSNGSSTSTSGTYFNAGCITKITDATDNPGGIVPSLKITAVTSPTVCYNTAASLTATVTGGTTTAMTCTWNIGGGGSTTTLPHTTTGNLTAAATYTVTATNANGCTSAVSSAGTITVRPEFKPGAIASTGQTICYNATPGAIASSAAAAGGGGAITYEWRRNGAAISGANAAGYTPTAYKSTAGAQTFTRWVKNSECNTAFVQSSGRWVLTVRNNFTAGAIASTGQTVCAGAAVNAAANSTAASGGGGAITYEWRRNGAAISSTNAAGYTPAAYKSTVGAHTFTRWAKNSECNTAFVQSAGKWVLTVNTAVAAAAIAGGAGNTCPAATLSLTATAAGATSYTWYKGGSQVQNGAGKAYTVTATGAYTVRGYNAKCTGAVSAAKNVTINDCRGIPGCENLKVYQTTAAIDGSGDWNKANNYCKARGARLPNPTEAKCMCKNHTKVPGGLPAKGTLWSTGKYSSDRYNCLIMTGTECLVGGGPTSDANLNFRCVL
ncbi:MAG: hypothetical protein LBN98_00265 [Prevotellaceae bacterium]|jgi:hypothetical protein|nr:hypothetical protein [Prevotellaceae bacterium]